ncbi:MAG: hypothetical protein ACREQ9_16390, partial [Candidatus Binatia bacterium]
MSRALSRLLGAVAIGAFLGLAFWFRSPTWGGAPLPVGLPIAVGALVGAVLAFFTDLPLSHAVAPDAREGVAAAREERGATPPKR